MERFTVKMDGDFQQAGIKYLAKQGGDYFELVNKLGELEDAEEQGLLLRLPCKVGDKIYHIEDGYMYDFKADSIEVRKENGKYIFCIAFMDYKEEDFGKTAFLTEEAAEQALKEGVGNE